MVIFMHLSREIDGLLDSLIEQKNKLGKEKGKSQKILAEIKEIKAEIKKLTHEGERAKGLWTDKPEFTHQSIF
jgi:DNA-binding transcriptional regulator GbsR (MarR family)